MERAIVKGSPAQMLNHPWVYSGNLVECKAEKGASVEVYSKSGVFLGSAIYNPESSIALRFYSRKRDKLDYYAIKERIILADGKRKRYFTEPYYRIVFSESDMLPGLIIDRYGNGFVLQINSYGMEIRRSEIVKALYDVFQPDFIVERSSGYSRRLEGLKENSGVLMNESGLDLTRVIVAEGGLKYYVDLLKGQKTGFYYDQRRNREIIENYISGGIVMDLFSYVGAFTLRALRKANKVFAVDISEESITLLKENVKFNGFSEDRIIVEVKDAFDFLEEVGSLKLKFDFIIMDPPSFAKRGRDVESAIASYIELVSKGIDILENKGQMAIFSCSNYIKWEHFASVLQRGTRSTGRSFSILDYMYQDFRDHRVPTNFPEAEYLRGYIIKEDI
ncbi:MAG TPA: class I SAM-dependent rRNA methyltransferase [Candidatus Hydrothermia bacterium]|nr:class I SAM-dependent rRNA methyltransferase [Candidatus Hydrothermae bacterium]MDD3648727.1 class I SAM-dependent rRNA methyltransferase [Candidatus Hydrothermia bacterium]MDD5573255.1 class I SAM-dependent rRNA methyltransferase [Candidatus Hydrothermia bacterium]HRD23041.1 class I SAM-dependent rRNA methyltransferase [Candidatus Hydrothermia bacterium]